MKQKSPMATNVPPKGSDVFARLAAQLAELTAKVRTLSEAMAEESQKVGHQQKKKPDLKVIDVRTLDQFVEPVDYYDEKQVDNERTIDLRRQLHAAEAELESAETWVECTRAEENVRTLRRELGYAEFERPWATHHNLIGVPRQAPEQQRFAPPTSPFADRADCEARADKFDRRTGQ